MKMRSITRNLLAGMILASATHLAAADLLVNTPVDGSLPGACTLHDAVDAANNDRPVNGCRAGSGADKITFNVSGTIALNATLSVNSVITIDGAGQRVTIDGGGQVQIFNNTGTLELRNLTVANGSGRHPREEGTAAMGGGAYNSGSLTIMNCTFSGNLGGALSGGGIYNVGDVTISGSTFLANWSFSGGGGISNAGLNSRLTISNSTFSGNIAESGGGAIVNFAMATILNSSFVANRAGGGGAIDNRSTLHLANTILANSLAGGDCSNLGGVIHSSGVNLVMDGSCAIPGALPGDPLLGPLADNGGATQTHAPMSGSPVINAGDVSVCAAPPVSGVDQRGQARGTDGKCDLGAYESATAAPFTITLIPNSETISRGNVAGFILQVRPLSGFIGTVRLSCAGGPPGTQCGVLPHSVPVRGTAYAVSAILFPRNTPDGTYPVTFTGVSGQFTSTAVTNVTLR